jgi:alpha-glucoside transport system permease protein
VGQLLSTIVSSAIAILATAALFVAVNKLFDLPLKNFRLFATVAGAALGAFLGLVVNSGGWFLGGALWPLGGAVVGALFGFFVWGRRNPSRARRTAITERSRPAIFLAPALLFLFLTLVAPTIRTIYLSLRNSSGDEFVGLDNFQSIFTNDSIFNVNGLGDLVGSRLFFLAVLVIALGIGWTILSGTRSRTGVDMTAPTPVLALLIGGFLVVLAAVGSLRAVIWNNVYWIVFVVLISTAAGLAIAVLADKAKGENVAKSLIFMPMAISFVGASVIWRFVYAFTPAGRDQIGLLNAVWVGLGGEPQAWIQQLPWNTLFLIAIMIWIQTGFAMVVLSAAIKAVPTELTEAARVDGATAPQIFWRVTIPQIRSTLLVVVVTLTILVLKVYDIVKVMTNGEFGTNVIANEMFDQAFIARNRGVGSALAVVLLVAVIPMMVLNARRVRREALG